CNEILHYGGMGHTAGIHTRSREAAIRYGAEMPASRVTVNTPTTHGAIGFSTALPPSMTLGCGSWGGNVTSDNISPLHLMDIKRIAYETRPVTAASETAAQATVSPPPMIPPPAYVSPLAASAPPPAPPVPAPAPPQLDREAIAALVDKFLATRRPPVTAGTIDAGPNEARAATNGPATQSPAPVAAPKANPTGSLTASNGHRPVDF